MERKIGEKELPDDAMLSKAEVAEIIVEGGRARLRPVILTAITTVLGLIPLAIGVNIDFFGLFSKFEAGFYLGGDNVIFWGPLAWAVIYGLIIATFLTLIIVPLLFFIVYRIKLRIRNWRSKSEDKGTAYQKAA